MSNFAYVHFVPTNHCFVILPQSLAERILKRSSETNHDQTVLELSWTHQRNPQRVYVGWAGEIYQPEELADQARTSGYPEIQLDTVFGHALGLVHYQKVALKVLRHVATATRVFVEPVSENDWEILELQAAKLEHAFLQQVRVLAPGQQLPLRLQGVRGAQSVIQLKVQAHPDLDPCRLVAIDTEVAVQPKPRARPAHALCLRIVADPRLEHVALLAASTLRDLRRVPGAFEVHLLLPHLTAKAWAAWTPEVHAVRTRGSEGVPEGTLRVPAAVAAALAWMPESWGVSANVHGALVKCTPTDRLPAQPTATPAPGGGLVSPADSDADETLHAAPPLYGLSALTHFYPAPWRPSALLLTGPAGSGKTFLAKSFLADLQHHATAPWTAHLPCAHHQHAKERGEVPRTAVLHDLMSLAFSRRPSVLVLDDIDQWVPASDEEEEERTRGSDSMAWQLVTAITSMQHVYVVLIAKQSHTLHPMFKAHYAIQKEISLGQGGADELTQLHQYIMNQYSCHADVNPTKLALMTEGFLAQDCVHLFQRAYHYALTQLPFSSDNVDTHAPAEHQQVSVCLSMHHFQEALRGYRPLRVARGVETDAAVPWSRVGGMVHAKRVLLETFQWPLRYPELVAAARVPLRTGVLLYGYPGCGKTWVGRAVAREAGMHLIHVRGPELLNKYVGGSEAQVRDVFARARSAAPCLVFFDELEALAPRRGSSGVADRVVNMLLTEMDGVEGRKGVFLLGATSRPDLVDAAVLRPGRLDRRVCCGYPTAAERREILETIAGTTPTRTDWAFWAAQTEGFSCADLHGFLTQAHLVAVQEQLDRLSLANATDTSSLQIVAKADPPCDLSNLHAEVGELGACLHATPPSSSSTQPLELTDAHLLRALELTTPSLPSATKAELSHIYDLFSKGQVDVPSARRLKFK